MGFNVLGCSVALRQHPRRQPAANLLLHAAQASQELHAAGCLRGQQRACQRSRACAWLLPVLRQPVRGLLGRFLWLTRGGGGKARGGGEHWGTFLKHAAQEISGNMMLDPSPASVSCLEGQGGCEATGFGSSWTRSSLGLGS